MSKSLRDLAKGQMCMVRIEGLCNWTPETTVLAHIRRAGNGGTGLKPPDICGVWACSACHDEIDRRTRILNIEQLNYYILDALCRQLCWYAEHEIIAVVL